MSRPIELTTDHVQLMRELNTYRLLDQSMMRRLGSIGRDRERVGEAARLLVRKNLAARTKAPLVAGVRRLPHLYWLTHKGAATLNQLDGLEDDAAALGATRRFGHLHEVMHRIGIVELHLAARAWCEAAGVALDRFVSDFEPGSRGRQKATTLDGDGWRFTPDALAWVRLPGEDAQRLLVFELERGGELGDLSPFLREKLPHLRALAAGEYIERRLSLPGLARFLIVFGSAAMRDRALERWPDPAAAEWGGFFVKSLDELGEAFGDGWHQPGDRPQRSLFAKLAPPEPGAT